MLTAVNDDAIIDLEVGSCTMPRDLVTLQMALYGRLPANPPAPLEDFIGSAVKMGVN